MEQELEMVTVLRETYNRRYMFLVLVLVGIALALLMTLLLSSKEYLASTTLIVNKEEAKLFYEDKYTQGDIDMYEKMMNTYIEIAKSDRVISEVLKKFPEYEKKQLEEMISQKAVEDTLIIELNVLGSVQGDVAPIANAYGKAVIDTCYQLIPAGSLEVVDEARRPSKAQPYYFIRNLSIGGLGGLLLGIIIIFVILYINSTKLVSTEDVISEFHIPVWQLHE